MTGRERIGWIIAAVALGLLLAQVVAADTYPRFVRKDFSALDERASVQVIEDRASGHCYAVFSTRGDTANYLREPVAVTYLGNVPCEPLSGVLVPMPVLQPASPIK
jgi:hypothetical protein